MTKDDAATPGPPSTTRTLMGSTFCDFRATWKTLALTDIAFKIIAFIVLTPLVGVLFRILIAASGSAVLSDLDILLFFLGPVGWICFIFSRGALARNRRPGASIADGNCLRTDREQASQAIGCSPICLRQRLAGDSSHGSHRCTDAVDDRSVSGRRGGGLFHAARPNTTSITT